MLSWLGENPSRLPPSRGAGEATPDLGDLLGRHCSSKGFVLTFVAPDAPAVIGRTFFDGVMVGEGGDNTFGVAQK